MAYLALSLSALFLAATTQADPAAPGVALDPRSDRALVVRKTPVTDCRAVRGFLGTPVDGSVRSRDYRGIVREYPSSASDGVAYAFNRNDGLHVTLADANGFDVVVLRGGARARMRAGSGWLTEPAGRPLHEFPGSQATQTACFTKRVREKAVSFFGVEGGALAEVSFYRIERAAAPDGAACYPSGEEITLRPPDSNFVPDDLYRAMVDRYGQKDCRAWVLAADKGGGKPLALPANRPVHFLTAPTTEEKGLLSLALDAALTGPSGPISLTAAVQDPLDPRLDLAWLEFSLPGPGRVQLVLDIPDQVLLKGSRVWLTLRADRDATLSGPEGGPPVVRLQFASREKALPEALAWRKLLLRTFFSLLSEPRPWGAYKKQPREEFFASGPYAAQCPELFMTIDRCHALDPNDGLVRQYREWVYAANLDSPWEVPAPPAPPKGVPDWAWYPRLAWLETRRITEWWIDNRMVPTGEFGGRVGDDSDMYQQYADLPFFETGGVAGKLKDAAARMAELADRENLRGGLNIHATDALHAYEEGINHLALMARWCYGDPVYLERCMDSARNMEALTIRTEDGRRHFRDKEKMGADDMKSPREPKIDGHACPLMWHAALQFADYNRNPAALKLLREWADTWLKLMKPGQWATDVEVRSGKVVESHPDRPLYGGYRSQACAFTWLYALTGDKRYLEPFLHYYRRGAAPLPAGEFLGDAYSLGALNGLDANTLAGLAPYNPALALYVTGDPNSLVQAAIGKPRTTSAGINSLYDALRWPDMYTTSEQFTDRVFPHLLQHASTPYLGGFARRNKFNPTLAVSWEGLGTEYGALVLVNRPERVKVLVHSLAESPITGAMRVWALEHGKYRLTAGPDADGDFKPDKVERTETLELARADAVSLALPPKTTTVIELVQTERLEPVFARADLALSVREVQWKDDSVTGIAHNIGAADAEDAVVAVLDAQGRTVARQSLGRLPAPADLVPKRKEFSLRLPSPAQPGWRVLLDPDRKVPEIHEGNNEARFAPGSTSPR